MKPDEETHKEFFNVKTNVKNKEDKRNIKTTTTPTTVNMHIFLRWWMAAVKTHLLWHVVWMLM